MKTIINLNMKTIINSIFFNISIYINIIEMNLNEIDEIIQYKYLCINQNNLLDIIKIKYKSDNLFINGYIFKKNKCKKKLPVVIYCRGGNNHPIKYTGIYTPSRIINNHTGLFDLIYKEEIILFFSNYRDNGFDEFGGKDINDIINLYPIITKYKYSNCNNIALFAWSRGCMMAFLVHKKVNWIKCIIVGAPNVNLIKDKTRRPKMYNILINDFNLTDKDLIKRSAINWIYTFPKTVPILILHGTADWRVNVHNSFDLALKLQKYKIPYQLMIYPGGDHVLSEYKSDVHLQVTTFLIKYLINNEQHNINLEYHGK
jgi:dipeptidyl aminopeptidase/acylaminoacyl peptidase